MNKSLATLTLILFCFIGRAQSVSKTDLTGKWQVTSALMSDTKDSPEIMEKMDVLRKCYENAIIDFKEDGKFFIEFKKTIRKNSQTFYTKKILTGNMMRPHPLYPLEL